MNAKAQAHIDFLSAQPIEKWSPHLIGLHCLLEIASAIRELAEAVRERPGDVHYHHTHLPMETPAEQHSHFHAESKPFIETPKEPGWVPSGYPSSTAGN